MRVKTRTISNDIEKDILIGMIVDDEYCKEITPIIRKDFFKIDYAAPLVDWISGYCKDYNKAPQEDIQLIYTVEKNKLPSNIQKLVQIFLENLSDKYNPEKFNAEYLTRKTKKYFETRSLEVLFENGMGLLRSGQKNEAIKLLNSYGEIRTEISDVFDPLENKEINNSFMEDDDRDLLFTFDGALGELIGRIERNNLISFTAPEKRGKSWWLMEFVLQAMLSKCKVLWINLEMSKSQIKKRFYSRLTGRPTVDIKEIIYPIFDCINNQDGSCSRKVRTNTSKENIISNLLDGEEPQYKDYPNHIPCSACKDTDRFISTYWYNTENKIKKNTSSMTRKKAKNVKSLTSTFNGKSLLRVKTFPAFSANSDDIRLVIDELASTEGFEADILVIDYIDILAQESGNFSERGNIDAMWKNFKNIAAVNNICVATADQSNKATYGKDIELGDTSEDKRKNAHLDKKIAINQTLTEKEIGIMRLAKIADRHEEFNPKRQVMVLQALRLGQCLMDSEWIYNNHSNENKK